MTNTPISTRTMKILQATVQAIIPTTGKIPLKRQVKKLFSQ